MRPAQQAAMIHPVSRLLCGEKIPRTMADDRHQGGPVLRRQFSATAWKTRPAICAAINPPLLYADRPAPAR